MPAARKPRDIAVHGDGLGDRRYYRYCAAFDRADRAMQDGYYLEAITLLDSLIFDRLSSRLYHLTQRATKRQVLGRSATSFSVAGKAARRGTRPIVS
jgi:hypothetical protein